MGETFVLEDNNAEPTDGAKMDWRPLHQESNGAEAMTKILQNILETLQDSTIVGPSGKDVRSRFWAKYKQVSEEYDNEFLERHNDDMGIVLIFSGLFSAINTAFIVVMQPNPVDTTNILLSQLVHGNAAGQGPESMSSSPYPWFLPLTYASLSLSLLAAFGAVLGKQWLGHYKSSRYGHGSLEERGKRRQQKLDGLEAWHLDAMLQAFPVLLQISLLLFGVALSAYVWTQQHAASSVLIATTVFGLLFYISTIYTSLRSHDCPFQTPVSSIIRLSPSIIQSSGKVLLQKSIRTQLLLLVMFRPGLAQKPRLWLGLRRLWLSQDLGRAKAPTHGLALARLGPSHGFWHTISYLVDGGSWWVVKEVRVSGQ